MALNYERIGWKDAPSTETPIDAASLNHMDNGILAVSDELDTELPIMEQKVDKAVEDVNDAIEDVNTAINSIPGTVTSTVNTAMDEKFGDDIADDVSSWLTEHVDPVGSAVVVDDTLSISGAAADAAKCGELKGALNRISSSTDNIFDEIFVLGYVDVYGNIVTGTRLVAKNLLAVEPSTAYYMSKPDVVIYIHKYGSDKSYIGYDTSFAGSRAFTTASDVYFIRLEAAPAYGSVYNNDIAIFTGSTAKPYIQHASARDIIVRNNLLNLNKQRFSFNQDDYDIFEATVIRSTDQPCISFERKVGEELYIHLRAKFPNDMHNVSTTNIQFIDIYNKAGSGKHFKAKLHKQTPTQRSENPKYPFPVLNSGIWTMLNDNITNNDCKLIPNGVDKFFALGKDTMSIRFTGDCTLSENQDIMLRIWGNSLTIYHNGGSNIASYDLTVYTTVKDLYNKIAEDIENNVLVDFEVEEFNALNVPTSNLLRGVVNLVAQYQTRNADNSISGYTEWRAFPYYFPTMEDDKVHDIEILFKDDCTVKAQFILDGYGIPFTPADYEWNDIFDNECIIQIGDSSISTGGMEILDFQVSNKADFKHPNLRVYYSECARAGQQSTSGYYMSEEVLRSLYENLYKNDFGSVDFRSILEYVRGNINLPNKPLAHFSHDDSSWDSLMDEKLRSAYLENDVIPSFGIMLHTGTNETRVASAKLLRNIGFWYMIHTVYNPSDQSYGQYSIGLVDYPMLVQLVDNSITEFSNLFGELPIVWDFHSTYECYNQVNYLKHRGFEIIFRQSGYGLLTPINRYGCARTQIVDSLYNASTLTALSKYYDNYIAEKRLY